MTPLSAARLAPVVLHVSQPVEAGVAGVVSQLVSDQVARGWPVSVACPAGHLAARSESAGARWLAWDARRDPGMRTARELRDLRRIVAVVAPDVIHLHSSKAGLAGRLAVRRRTPTIFQPHAWSFHAVGGARRVSAIAWERLAGRWTTTTICVSRAECAEGQSAGIRGTWRLIPNGVDERAFDPCGPGGRASARSRLGIPPDAPFAVCVGRLSRQKGQDVLLGAWPRVRSRFGDARLALVGDGPMGDELARSLPEGVTLAGHRDDVADWYRACDVVVLPSRWEGMSLALLEAMASGRAVVTTDVAGATEALGLAGGAIVPVESLADLADAIAARFADPDAAAAEGAANRRRVEDRFTLARMCGDVAELTLGLSAAR